MKEIEKHILECANEQRDPKEKYASMSFEDLCLVSEKEMEEAIETHYGSNGLFPAFSDRESRIPLKDIIDLIRVYIVGLHHRRHYKLITNLFSSIADPSLRVRDSWESSLRVRDSSESDESENDFNLYSYASKFVETCDSNHDTLLDAWVLFMEAYVSGIAAEAELERLGLKEAVDRFIVHAFSATDDDGFVDGPVLTEYIFRTSEHVKQALSGVDSNFLWPKR